jgi:hypothetical protein
MLLLTVLAVALALSTISSDNFYANKVTNASINDFNNHISPYATDVIKNKKYDGPKKYESK